MSCNCTDINLNNHRKGPRPADFPIDGLKVLAKRHMDILMRFFNVILLADTLYFYVSLKNSPR